MSEHVQLLAIFPYIDDLIKALRVLKWNKIDIPAVHSPVPNREIGELMGKSSSPIRYFTLCGCILGVLTGFGLSRYTAWQWEFIVSGKPPVPIVPYVIVAFEFCILFGVLFTVIGMLIQTRLPKWKLPKSYDARVTGDRFSVVVNCPAEKSESVTQMLHDAGAEEIHAVT